MTNAPLSDGRAGGSRVSGVWEPVPGTPERLLRDLIAAALPSTVSALERAVALIARHPRIAYALLEVAPRTAGSIGLRIEAESTGFPGSVRSKVAAAESRGGPAPGAAAGIERWPLGSGEMPAALRERGMASAARLPVGDPALGVLTIASRSAAATSDHTLDWCEAAAGVLQLALLRQQTEYEAAYLQRAELVCELSAAAVHDLNNALTGIIGFSSILRAQLPDDHPGARAVRMIDSLGVSGADLTRQLLDFARRDEGHTEIVDLNEVARRVRSLTSTTTGKGIDVELELTEPLPSVHGEASLLAQALTNLVLNAADAMPGGGRVLMRTRVIAGEASESAGESAGAPGDVAVEVSDQGTGIDPDVLPHIFEPFFTTKPAGSGTGLGLVSVRRIARRHGGRVEVRTAPGAGSTFTIVLPAADGEERDDAAVVT